MDRYFPASLKVIIRLRFSWKFFDLIIQMKQIIPYYFSYKQYFYEMNKEKNKIENYVASAFSKKGFGYD